MRYFKRNIVFAGAVLALCLPLAAQAQVKNRCAPNAPMKEALKKGYGETRHSYGLTKTKKSIIEILISENGTWTILQTNTGGMSCIMAVGSDWVKLDKSATH